MDAPNQPPPPYSGPQAQPPYYAPQYTPPPPPQNPLRELLNMAKAMLWSTSFISYLILLLFSLTIVLAMTPAIQHWILTPYPGVSDSSAMLYHEDIFLITPFYVHLFYLDGSGFQAWHILILGILVAGFAQAIHGLWKKWLSRPNQIAVSLTAPGKADSSLEGIAKLFMASMSFSFIYFLFLYVIGVEMRTPNFDSLSTPHLIYVLFSASVFEELISRVLLIGVPLVFLGILLKWKQPHRKILGGGLDLTPMTFALIAISATIFAFAHVGGWDYWKVPQVLIPGFALGWAFVRYGLHASMLIHFSINCTDLATEIWPDNMAVLSALGFVYLIWIVAGTYFMYVFSRKLLSKFLPKPAPMPVQPPVPQYSYPQPIYAQQAAPPQAYYPPPQPQYPNYPPPQPPPHPMQQGGFVCPGCGHTGATYEPGKLICLRCGQTYYRQAPAAPPPDKEQFEF